MAPVALARLEASVLATLSPPWSQLRRHTVQLAELRPTRRLRSYRQGIRRESRTESSQPRRFRKRPIPTLSKQPCKPVQLLCLRQPSLLLREADRECSSSRLGVQLWHLSQHLHIHLHLQLHQSCLLHAETQCISSHLMRQTCSRISSTKRRRTELANWIAGA